MNEQYITKDLLINEYKKNWSNFIFENKVKTAKDIEIIKIFDHYLEELEEEVPEIFENLAEYCSNLLDKGTLVLAERYPVDTLLPDEDVMQNLVVSYNFAASGQHMQIIYKNENIYIFQYIEGVSFDNYEKYQLFTKKNSPEEIVQAIIRANPLLASISQNGFDIFGEDFANFVLKAREVTKKSDYSQSHYNDVQKDFVKYFEKMLTEEHRYEMFEAKQTRKNKKAFVDRKHYFTGRLSVAMNARMDGFFDNRNELGTFLQLNDEDLDSMILLSVAPKLKEFDFEIDGGVRFSSSRNEVKENFKFLIKDLYTKMLGFTTTKSEEDKIKELIYYKVEEKLECLLDYFMKQEPGLFVDMISGIGVNLHESEFVDRLDANELQRNYEIKKIVKRMWERVIGNVLLKNYKYLEENEEDIPKQIWNFIKTNDEKNLDFNSFETVSFKDLKANITRIASKHIQKKYLESVNSYQYFKIDRKSLYDHLMNVEKENDLYYDYAVFKSYLKINETNEYFDILFANQQLIFVIKKDVDLKSVMEGLEQELVSNRDNYLINYIQKKSFTNGEYVVSLLPNIMRAKCLEHNLIESNNEVGITRRRKI